jgi:hypothetical protein
MRNEVNSGLFRGYKVNDSLCYNMLKLADDTILLCESSWNIVWTIKYILRSFELMSCLNIFFNKSNIYCLNLNTHILDPASCFLSRRVLDFPFKFLRMPVGANLKQSKMWQLVLDLFEKRLARWKGEYLSMGGRVVLILFFYFAGQVS